MLENITTDEMRMAIGTLQVEVSTCLAAGNLEDANRKRSEIKKLQDIIERRESERKE